MRKILIFLKVVQIVSNNNRTTKSGRGFHETQRLNPYNPLSYIIIIVSLVAAILMFGFVGAWREIDFVNPFKWQ